MNVGCVQERGLLNSAPTLPGRRIEVILAAKMSRDDKPGTYAEGDVLQNRFPCHGDKLARDLGSHVCV